ncbi:MAG TPA: hypothetical protein EYN69_04910 [Flavobacteriales bacterium]|nr:hypothetical protein [Flavobacteriales bacterium]
MPTNIYTNNYKNTSEQNLIHDLLIESIKFYGMDMYWLPRRSSATADQLFGEDSLASFEQAFLLEMYIKNVEGFEGEGEFLSKFGLEIRDQAVFTVSIKRFEQIDAHRVLPSGASTTPFVRPREGDLIYFPLNGKLFEIKFVEHESIFYTAGTLPVYDLRCELFVYDNQTISTGIEEIDLIATKYKAATTLVGTGSTTVDNDMIEEEANTILDFSETNPFGNF